MLDLIRRNTPKICDNFILKTIEPDGEFDRYEVYAEDGKIVLAGNSNLSLAMAYYRYLSEYCGMEVTLYTYRVLNDEYADEEVLAQLYVSNGCVIGGDVHSTALDGFMCGIRK